MNQTRSLAVALIVYLMWLSDSASGRPTSDNFLTLTQNTSDVPTAQVQVTGPEGAGDSEEHEFESYTYDDDNDIYNDYSSFDMTLTSSRSTRRSDTQYDRSQSESSDGLDASESPSETSERPNETSESPSETSERPNETSERPSETYQFSESPNEMYQSSGLTGQAEAEVDQAIKAVKRHSGGFSGFPNALPEPTIIPARHSEKDDIYVREDSTVTRSSNNAIGGDEGLPDRQRELAVTEVSNYQTGQSNNRAGVITDNSGSGDESPSVQENSTTSQLQPCETNVQTGALPNKIKSNDVVSNRQEADILQHGIQGSNSQRSSLGRSMSADLDRTVSDPVVSDNDEHSESSLPSLDHSNNTSDTRNSGIHLESIGENVRISEGGSNSSRPAELDIHLVSSDNGSEDNVFPEVMEHNQKAGELPDTAGQQEETHHELSGITSDSSFIGGSSVLPWQSAISPTRSLNHMALSTITVMAFSVEDQDLELSEANEFTRLMALTESILSPSSSYTRLRSDDSVELIINSEVVGDYPSQVLTKGSTFYSETTLYDKKVLQISPSEVVLDTSTIRQTELPVFADQTCVPVVATAEPDSRSAHSIQSAIFEITRTTTGTLTASQLGTNVHEKVINADSTTLSTFNLLSQSSSSYQSTDVSIEASSIINIFSDSYSTSLLSSLSLSTSVIRITDNSAVIPSPTKATTGPEITDYNNSMIDHTTATTRTDLKPSSAETVTSTTAPYTEPDAQASNRQESYAGTNTTSAQSATNVGLYGHMTQSGANSTRSPNVEGNGSSLDTTTMDNSTTFDMESLTPGNSTTLDMESLTPVNTTSSAAARLEWPSSFIELTLGMSWPDFCQNEMSIRGELVEILQSRDEQVEVTADQIRLMNRERDECYKVQLSDTDVISVRMYIIDKAHHFDRSLTLVCANILVSGLSGGYSSTIRNKFLAVSIHDDDGLELATGASINRDGEDQEASSMFADPGITIAIALASIGGSYCLGLVVLQIFLRQRKRGIFVSGLSRSYSVTSSDSIQLSSVNKSRPNSGLFNPGLDLTDQLEPSNPLNFVQLAKFCLDENKLSEEYQKIPHRMARLSVVPPGDEDKNRYANVLPLAHTRVMLHHDGFEPRSSYINANYVTGPGNESKYYIATQAPTEKTTHDFWSMVWQHGCAAIVMLTQLEEEGQVKCASYFPELVGKSAAQRHGDFLIELKHKDVHQEYIASKLEINNLREIETKEIDHFWYTCWPPVGVPEPISLVKLVLDTRPKYEGSKSPLVVHCSPGTGRTCTFIALDLCMRQFEERRTVDVMKTVYGIRQERAGAIQNKEQYSLLYNAVTEYATVVVSPVISAASSATTLHALLPS